MKKKKWKKGELGTDESVAFTGLKREFLLIHGVGIKMREGISGGAESGVHGAIDFIETRLNRFSLLRHGME
jgi:hypothetical protein